MTGFISPPRAAISPFSPLRTTGVTDGKITVRKMPNSLGPSMRTASMWSLETISTL
jgi:hypothetical protein